MRKTKSAILEAVHETAKGLHAAGVMEQVTLREFDRLGPAARRAATAGADQANPRDFAGEPGGLRRAAEHQPFDGAEVGDRPKEAHGCRPACKSSPERR